MFTEARLAGGLVLEYLELGDPEGVPVVYQPGSPSTAGGGALLDEAAQRHGVRLVSVSRPGYGASTPTPPGLASVGRQVHELADHLGWATFGTLGSSGGGPFALATAALAPDRVARVGIAAGSGIHEPAEREDPGTVSADIQAFVDGVRDLDDAGVRAVIQADLPPNEHYFDSRPAEAATFFADLRRALRRPDGFARDNLSWGQEWDVDVTTVTVPVALVYGEDDQMVPCVHGERLAALLPDASLTVLPGGGHGDATFGASEGLLAFLRG